MSIDLIEQHYAGYMTTTCTGPARLRGAGVGRRVAGPRRGLALPTGMTHRIVSEALCVIAPALEEQLWAGGPCPRVGSMGAGHGGHDIHTADLMLWARASICIRMDRVPGGLPHLSFDGSQRGLWLFAGFGGQGSERAGEKGARVLLLHAGWGRAHTKALSRVMTGKSRHGTGGPVPRLRQSQYRPVSLNCRK